MLRSSVGVCLLSVALAMGQDIHQATGVKVGEVTENSAIVWMRVTREATRNWNGMPRQGPPHTVLEPGISVESLEGETPGAPGRVRLRYSTRADLRDAVSTAWTDTSADRDYAHQFVLGNLLPETAYYFSAETSGPGGSPQHAPLRGSFHTAPPANKIAEIVFTVITCQGYNHVDHRDGFHIYPAMAALKPDFLVFTGDNVYYDTNDPLVNSVELARYHWHRMFSFPRHIDLLRQIATYWEKDDHDTAWDDCYPTMDLKRTSPFTFQDGQRIFLEQVPMGPRIYRTFRWGKLLQIWLTEGRDFRSPNKAPDSPEKTIWGTEQKAWLKKSLLQSDAAWKVLISPTPIVGPDRKNKSDNHSNTAFAHEGNEFRLWVQKNLPKNFFVVCGDRHWQYHSVDPTTQVQEFACGAASDPHAGGTPGENPRYHRFHRVRGGFLSVSVRSVNGRAVALFRHHDVFGGLLYEQKFEGPL